jgi:hypothetical protein
MLMIQKTIKSSVKKYVHNLKQKTIRQKYTLVIFNTLISKELNALTIVFFI